jgi:hypothetical protein
MASRRPAVDAVWIEALGHSIGVQLGKAIAKHLQTTLAESVDLSFVARRLDGSASGKRGRRMRGEEGGCTSPGCPNPVLAKSLCRSHYYKARYRSQKDDEPKKKA